MVESIGQVGDDKQPIVTSEMRAAGAAILLDPDFAACAEEKAEAVYIAMSSVLKPQPIHAEYRPHPVLTSTKGK